MQRFATLGVFLAALMGSQHAVNAASLPKQVAAPAQDIVAGRFALPDPSRHGVHSARALIPVEFTDNAPRQSLSLPVEAEDDLSVMLLSPPGHDGSLALYGPDGRLVSGAAEGPGSFGFGNNRFEGKTYRIHDPQAGIWHIVVERDGVKGDAHNAYLLIGSKTSPYRLYSHLSHYQLRTDQHIGLRAYVYRQQAQPEDAGVPLTGVVEHIRLRLRSPDNAVSWHAFYDDGRHDDGAAGDGVYGVNFPASQAGDYVAQVVAEGLSASGNAFLRTTEHVFPVVPGGLRLDAIETNAPDKDGRPGFRFQWRDRMTDRGAVQVAAELWGTDQGGQTVPVTWLSAMVEGGTVAELRVDPRWIQRVAAQAPFSLRNIRISDANTSIPLVQVRERAVELPHLPAGTSTAPNTLTQGMLMGPRPAPDVQAQAGGHKLMLVHGYCSGGVWPTADFTEWAEFADHDQNRSHDAFARLIRDFGAQFDSFGVVAHSQGGAAALHLYTYYWSGLDYATGSRLIQSVGTPYQGTALAGSLALIGEVFGAGCGTNFDLTYDGAALWLSGIPSWARSQVYYHTTSFEDRWWAYDYCHLATDPFLDDPDDGTTEKWAGQLSGAYNTGHTTGQCHTDSMRDPAQTQDHGRNAVMNSAAKR